MLHRSPSIRPASSRLRRLVTLAVAAGAAMATAVGLAPQAMAAVDPVLASPYLYQWGGQTSPTAAMSATGVKAFTLAFVLSDGTCNPKWDGSRSLTGSDKTMIQNIRNAGGDRIPSFSCLSGTELSSYLPFPSCLARSFLNVIDFYWRYSLDHSCTYTS